MASSSRYFIIPAKNGPREPKGSLIVRCSRWDKAIVSIIKQYKEPFRDKKKRKKLFLSLGLLVLSSGSWSRDVNDVACCWCCGGAMLRRTLCQTMEYICHGWLLLVESCTARLCLHLHPLLRSVRSQDKKWGQLWYPSHPHPLTAASGLFLTGASLKQWMHLLQWWCLECLWLSVREARY